MASVSRLRQLGLIVTGISLTLSACESPRTNVTVVIEPSSIEAAPWTTHSFAADVRGTLSGTVTWSIVRGSGSIDPVTGEFVAPGFVPAPRDNDIVVRATSNVDPGRWAEAHVYVVKAPIFPPRGPTEGGTVVAVEGPQFAFDDSTRVLFDGVESPAVTVLSAVSLEAVVPPRAAMGPVDVVLMTAGQPDVVYPRAFHYAATQLRFGGGQLLRSCSLSNDVVALDLDMDARPDLVTPCRNEDKVAVFVNDGDGGVSSPQFFPTGNNPWHVETGDVDGDGKAEIFVVTADGIDVFDNTTATGNAFVTLSPRARLPLPTRSVAEFIRMAPADLDGDGRDDLVIADYWVDNALNDNAEVSIYRNDGTGTFAAPVSIALPALRTYDIAVGDLDGVNGPDVVASYWRTAASVMGGFFVLLNDGTGGFGGPVNYPTQEFIRAHTLIDFDGDGDLDVATGSNVAGTITTRLNLSRNNGNGVFAAPILRESGDATFFNASMRTLDLDFDGNDDILARSFHFDAAGNEVNQLRLYYGTPTDLQNPVYVDLTRYCYGLTATDLDGAGELELVSAAYEQLEMYKAQGARVFGVPKVTIGAAPEHLDVRWRSSTQEVLAALRTGGSCAGGCGAIGVVSADFVSVPQTFDLPAGADAQRVYTAEVTGDGLPDAIVTDGGSLNVDWTGSVWILPGGADGSFGTPIQIPFDRALTDSQIADLDGDGLLDIVVTMNDSDGVTPPLAGELQVLWGTGMATFTDPVKVPAGVVPYRVQVRDLDGDGRGELITSDWVGSRVSVVRIEGGRIFAPPVHVEVGTFPTEIRIADVDEDHTPDLIVVSLFEDLVEINVARGLGGLRFDLPDRYHFDGLGHGFNREIHGLEYGDLDGDGLGDIAVTSAYPAAVAILRGYDGGRFRNAEFAPVGGTPYGVTIADFDADGMMDLVVGDINASALRPLLNQSR